jgi:hypothetical protein
MSRRSKKSGNEGEQYIQMYPQLQKWINQCVCCQEKGYNPDMPSIVGYQHDDFVNIYTAKKIKRFFKPLAVNEQGLCDVCFKEAG